MPARSSRLTGRIAIVYLAAAVLSNSAFLASAYQPAVPPIPSRVALDSVSQKYPVTLMNKLFSSVPKREYALQNINLSFGRTESTATSLVASPASIANNEKDTEGVTLLVGRSASGKSTLLRLLAGMELPSNGRVGVNGCWLDVGGGSSNQEVGTMSGTPSWAKMARPLPIQPSDDDECAQPVQPVMLQGKPDFDDKLTVMERLVQVGRDTIHLCNKGLECGEEVLLEERMGGTAVLEMLATDFATLLTLTNEQCNSVPSALSPSGEYLFGMACGCMMSVAPSLAAIPPDENDTGGCIAQRGVCYPILLLDELFDFEHPSTVEKCSGGITNLIKSGGVMISATHRPGYFEGIASRTVTLSGGKVLTDVRKATLEYL